MTAVPRIVIAGNSCYAEPSEGGEALYSELDERMLGLFFPDSELAVLVVALDVRGVKKRSRPLPDHIETRILLCGKWARGVPRLLATPWALGRLCSFLGDRDVVYGRLPSPIGLLILVAALLTGRPYICSLHGEPQWARKSKAPWTKIGHRFAASITRGIIKRSHLSFVTSRGLIQLYGAVPERSTFFRNSLLEAVPPLSDKAAADEVRLVFVGRLSAEKNPTAVLDLGQSLSASGVKTRIQMVGDGPLRSQLEALAALGSYDCEFTGWADHESVKNSILASDFLILPSLNEGSPKVLVEAMALGTVVCTWLYNEDAADFISPNSVVVGSGPHDVSGWSSGILGVWRNARYDEMRATAWSSVQEQTRPKVRAKLQAELTPLFEEARREGRS